MTSSWGNAWGSSWGNAWGDIGAAVATGDSGSAAAWWWHQRQPVPYGTQPARAYGTDLWLSVGLDPGTASGAAKTKGRRLRREVLADKAMALGWALAGDASAIVIPARVGGEEIRTVISMRAGAVSAGARTGAPDLSASVRFVGGKSTGHAITAPRELRAEVRLNASVPVGHAVTTPRTLRAEVRLNAAVPTGRAVTASRTLRTGVQLLPGQSFGHARVIAMMRTASTQIESGGARGGFGFDPIDLDNDLLMLAAA